MSLFEKKRTDAGRKIRIAFFLVTAALIAYGVVMIYSASAIFADQKYGDGMFFLKKHLIFLVAGTVAAGVVMTADYRRLRELIKPILVLTVLSLLVVLIFSATIGGARRWIALGPINVQPSEFAKLSVVIFMAYWISREGVPLRDFRRQIMLPGAVVGLICLLILMGRDFGTTVVIGMVFVLMLFFGGIPKRYLAWLTAAVAPVLGLAVLMEPYRVKRIVAFLNPFQDIRNTSFQLYQSLLAIGSGQFGGVGLGQSQQKLFYLPAAHTDFIFSIIGEELGFLGGAFLILLFIGFVVLGVMIASRAADSFGHFVCLGLVSLVSLEAMINIGVSSLSGVYLRYAPSFPKHP